MDDSLHITIRKVNNGWIYEVSNSIKINGTHVCKTTEEYKMIEKIGEEICEHKIKVIPR